ncbi:MAG: hypothetical protein Q9190_007859 [Brigantiaea leucoxantha]
MASTQPTEVSLNQDLSREQGGKSLSKNQIKKLRRDQAWEEGREKRRQLRKQKVKDKKQKRKAAREEAPQRSSSAGHVSESYDSKKRDNQRPLRSKQLPVSIVIDCGFDEHMTDGERKSLAAQITRCYSDNSKAPFKAHLALSSFGGHLKERYDTVLHGHHRNWKGVTFHEGDFEKVAMHTTELMQGPQGGQLAGQFESKQPSENQKTTHGESRHEALIYLTSDSPDTLTDIRPHTTYVIGGIVDRNRHKGICYKKAVSRGIKTAKLPIGDYMQMASRFVLATNHVMEIMLRWLELGDWAQAFLQVVPKRKGGVLKIKDGNGNAWEQVEPESEPEEEECGIAESSDSSKGGVELDEGVEESKETRAEEPADNGEKELGSLQ